MIDGDSIKSIPRACDCASWGRSLFSRYDKRHVEAQSHEIHKISYEIMTEGMSLGEQFQITVIFDKLPHGSKDFKNLLQRKTKKFSTESLITRLWFEEEARIQDHKDEVLVVSNNKKSLGAVLKPTGKPLKNQNRNVVNRIKNAKPSRASYALIDRQESPPHRNETLAFTYFNCWKPGYMTKKFKSMPKPVGG